MKPVEQRDDSLVVERPHRPRASPPSSSARRCSMNRSSSGISLESDARSGLVNGPASRASSGACCAACDRSRRRSSGSPGRCADRPNSRTPPPRGAGCRRRNRLITSCGATTLPLRLRHLLAPSRRGRSRASARRRRARGRACRSSPAARNGTSRDAGPSPSRYITVSRPPSTAALDAGKTGKLLGILEREGVGRAGIEPHVEDVVDLLVVRRGRSSRQQEARGPSRPRTMRPRPRHRKPPRCGHSPPRP